MPWNPAKYHFFFSRMLKRIPFTDIGNWKKYLIKEKNKVDMGRYIQPVIDVGFYPQTMKLDQQTLTGTSFQVQLRPLEDEIFLLDEVTFGHNGGAARGVKLRHDIMKAGAVVDTMQITDDEGSDVKPNVETPIFPNYHDIVNVGREHDHTIGIKSVQVERDIPVTLQNETAFVIGEAITIRWLYRKVK